MPVVSTRSTSTSTTANTDVGYGARGAAVSTLQQQLTAKGFPTAVDGEFGPDTLKQLKAFQHTQGISVTARVDATTTIRLTASAAPAAPTMLTTPATPRADAGTVTDARRRAMNNPNLALSVGHVPAPSIEQVAAGTGKLRAGMQGPAVLQLQTRLNADGENVLADGKFDAKTEAALKRWQAARDITDTGIYGPNTHAAMAANAPSTRAPSTRAPSTDETTGPAEVQSTRGMTETQKYDYYSQLAEQNGGQVKTGSHQKNIVGLRTSTDADAVGGGGSYDDKFAMFWTDAHGNKRATEYTGNTDPSARYRGRMGVDANGDGRLDQGRLPTGYFEFTTGSSTTLGRVLRPVQDYRVERDTNQDGVFGNDSGRVSSGGNSMLFHAGGSTITGSAGCQTMTPAEYARFWRDVNSGGSGGRVGYTLVEVD